MNLPVAELPTVRTNTAVRSVSRSASDEYPAMTLDGHQESVRMGAAASCPVLDPLIPILAEMVRLIMSAERFMTGATSSHERRDTDNDSVVNVRLRCLLAWITSTELAI
jgi:hypothetical protein